MNIQNEINVWIVKSAEIRDKDRGEVRISPSNAGKCLRQLMLMTRGAEADAFTPQQLLVFEAGHIFEEFIMNILEKRGLVTDRQKEIEYRGRRGKIDGLLHGGDKTFLMDCKTVHSFKFDWLDKEGPDANHCIQLAIYWLGLKAAGVAVEDSFCLLYVNKDTVLLKPMWVRAADWTDRANAVLSDIESVEKAETLPVEHGTEGAPEIDWQCFSVSKKFKTVKIWCRWIKHCPHVCAAHAAAVKAMSEPKIRKAAT